MANQHKRKSLLPLPRGLLIAHAIVADIFFCNFAGCSALASIECSSWDTSSVTDMAGMFFCCLLLSAVDVSSWDVSRVTSCDRMFAGCSFRRSAS